MIEQKQGKNKAKIRALDGPSTRRQLKAQGPGTRLIFDHTGFPEGKKEHLGNGWKESYWQKLHKYLG